MIRSAAVAGPVTLDAIYDAVEHQLPQWVDDERESGTTQFRWRHELRWELETLVVRGDVKRRKDLGRGWYSV